MNDDDLEKKGIEALQEQIEESPILNVEQPKNWWVLFTVLVVIAGLIIWSFVGRIPTEVTGRSVSLSSAGVFLVESPHPATITKIYVKEGAQVNQEESLAQFNNPKLRSILAAIEATKFKVERLTTQSMLLKKALDINIRLFKQGLIAKMVIDQSRSELMQKKIEIEDSKAGLSNSFSDLEQNAFINEKKFAFYKEILESPPDVIEFPKILRELSTMRAQSDGKVLEVLANQGEIVEAGEPIFWMERPHPHDKPPVFYGTVDSELRKRLREGLKVLIEPANVSSQEYGAIIGKVEEIYPYPVSENELKQSVGNPQIVRYLLEDKKAMMQITIAPEVDPETKSGYKWTSETGPPYEIPTGTVAKIRVVVDEQPPISYLLDFWKVKTP